jgi:hypothetical protein
VAVPATATGSVLERNNHPSRDGLFVQPQITKCAAKAAAKTKDAAFTANLTGATNGNMYASPLYLENGPGGTGAFFAVTIGNDVFALDETTGAVLWKANIGGAPSNNGSGCGNVAPLGILSTPVIDGTAKKIYVAGAIGTTSTMRHELHAISTDDGTDEMTGGWPVDVTKVTSGSIAFNAATTAQNQRGALSLVGGTIYVPYGGHAGDCGKYHGWVVGIKASDPTMIGAWATGGIGEGIWCAGGMASDGTGVFAATGNDLTRMTTHIDSEEVVRVTGLGVLDKTSAQNYFYPLRWMTMDGLGGNGNDYDLGSVNPIYVEVDSATTYVVQIAKDGHLYILDSKNLGGMGGQKVDFVVASEGMSIHTVPAAYKTAMGLHVVFTTDAGAMCPTGGPSGKVVMSVLIPTGASPKPTVSWCATLGSPVTAPIATTTDGTNESIVWYMSSGKLLGVDGDTGANIYTSTDTCSGVRQWTSPIAVKGRIIVGGDTHLCSWTVH